MYTILENAKIVISLLKEHKIRHIVISPGGSNIPIVQGVQNDPYFKCYSVVDERSAMYVAIGIYLQTGEIVATSCTSAQATRNYVPGLTEAFYKQVPVLAITMSKHPRYLGQEYMQCSVLTSLPVDTVKKSFSLPYISNANDRAQCIRTANEAILELTHGKNGPVQLNIEELDSETWLFNNLSELPQIRSIRRYRYDEEWEFSLNEKRIMLLIGEHLPFKKSEQDAIEFFCKKNNVFVYTNHTSNYFGKYARSCALTMNNISQSLFEADYLPDILITIGGLTGDYSIYGKLFNAPEDSFEHWRVARDGAVVDTYGKLTKVFESSVELFFTRMAKGAGDDHGYFEKWEKLFKTENFNISIPFSNIYAASVLSKYIPDYSSMHFAIHNSLRAWSYFQLNKTITCFSNVAAFGIDGCLSTFIGQSLMTEQRCFLIIGDLAFYYDMNAMGIRHIGNNVRILLVNNNGGAEFKLGDLETKTDVGTYIAADDHFRNAEGWARTCGFKYICASSSDEFNSSIQTFVGESDKPVIFEIFTRGEDERTALQMFNKENWHGNTRDAVVKRVKNEVKQLFGEKGGEILQKITNRKK